MNYITGRSGFIGRHLWEAISATWIPHDRLIYARFEPFDTFYFLSAYGNLHGQSDIDKIVQSNIQDVIDVFTQVRKVDFKSFVYLSTSAVIHGKPTPYSRTKRAAEEYLLSFDLPVCILRPYTVIGRGEQAQHLIPTLIKACYTGEVIDFVPWAEHDYIDVEDAVQAIIYLAHQPGIHEIRTNQIYTNQQIRQMVEDLTGKKVNVRQVENMRPYDTPTGLEIGNVEYKPQFTIEQTIRKMVNEYSGTPDY